MKRDPLLDVLTIGCVALFFLAVFYWFRRVR